MAMENIAMEILAMEEMAMYLNDHGIFGRGKLSFVPLLNAALILM